MYQKLLELTKIQHMACPHVVAAMVPHPNPGNGNHIESSVARHFYQDRGENVHLQTLNYRKVGTRWRLQAYKDNHQETWPHC